MAFTPWLFGRRWPSFALLVVSMVTSLRPAAGAGTQGNDGGPNPIQKVLELMGAIEAKIISDAEEKQRIYERFAKWCEERSRDLHLEIKKSKARGESLKADVEQSGYRITEAGTRIEQLSSEIASFEQELKKMTALRQEEVDTFTKYEQGLTDMVNTVEHAIGVLEKDLKNKAGTASLLQSQNAWNVVQAIAAMVNGYGLHDMGFGELTSLVQGGSADETGDARTDEASDQADSELSLDWQDPKAKQRSGSVVNVLEALLDKATSELSDLRHDEATKAGNFKLVDQSLRTKISTSDQALANVKQKLAEAGEKKATAEGDLSLNKEDLQEDIKSLDKLHHGCMSGASEFEEESKARDEELKAIAQAKKIVHESTSGAEQRAYSMSQDTSQDEADDDDPSPTPAPSAVDSVASLVQLRSVTQTSAIRATQLIKKLAKQRKSKSLIELFRYMQSMLRSKNLSVENPFAKVKTMISAMIDRLEKEAHKEAARKQYCDKEMADTQAKLDDKTDDMTKVATKVDQQSAESAMLSEEVSTLQMELAEIADAQKNMDEIRAKEKACYTAEKADLEQGVEGVRKAVQILRDYYAKSDDDDAQEQDSGGQSNQASSGILSLLEVIDTDFSKTLSALQAEEDSSQSNYDAETHENNVAKAEKEKVVQLKSKALKALGKSIAEMSVDRDNMQSEEDAVNEFSVKLKQQCVAKAEPHEEKVKRRDKEIAGLKEALEILGSQSESTSFLQRGMSVHRQLRGLVIPSL